MLVRVHINDVREIEIDDKFDAMREPDDLYGPLANELINECRKQTGVPTYDETPYNSIDPCIIGIYCLDGEPLMEW